MRTFTTLTALIGSAILLASTTTAKSSVGGLLNNLNVPALHVRSHVAKAQYKRDGIKTASKLTWYGGGQLSAPACGGETPDKHSLIAAVRSPKNGGKYECGTKLRMWSDKGEVTVIILDYCDGCIGPDHFDLPQDTYSALTGGIHKDAGKVHFQVVGKVDPKKWKKGDDYSKDNGDKGSHDPKPKHCEDSDDDSEQCQKHQQKVQGQVSVDVHYQHCEDDDDDTPHCVEWNKQLKKKLQKEKH